MKYWEILLLAQKERGKSGLTIPFLIGSQQFINGDYIFQNIEDLIIDIVNNANFEICLRYCFGTHTFILEKRNPKNNVIYLNYNNAAQLNLSLSLFSKDDFGNNIENLILRLEIMFQEIIDEEKYSAKPDVHDREPNWTSYTSDDDIPFILENFNKP